MTGTEPRPAACGTGPRREPAAAAADERTTVGPDGAQLCWYTSTSGWMVQAPCGLRAIDSFRPCDEHAPAATRDCCRCDDGPMIEAGYHLGEDAEGWPAILDDEDERVAASYDYQTADGSLRVRVGA